METKRDIFTKTRLFCPGPTPVPLHASLAAVDLAVYHRADDFYKEFLACRQGLAPLMGTKQLPLILTSSGTGALEAAVQNFTDIGDSVAVINAGKFGERWQKLCESYQCKTATLTSEWGTSVDQAKMQAFLESFKAPPKCFFIQANETSTGVFHPIGQIIPLVRSFFPTTLIVIDAISGLCAHSIPMDKWGIDILISASQKGFGLPPGLAFIALSKKAESSYSKRPRFYFDLKKESEGQDKGRAAWTTGISLIKSLSWVLEELNKIGIDAVVDHHTKMADAVRASIEEMGLSLFVHCPEHRSNAVTSISVPKDLDGKKLLSHLRQKYGSIISGGQDQLSGKIIRFAHLGMVDRFDVLSGLAALEWSLGDLSSLKSPLGTGVSCFLRKVANP